MKRIVRIEHKGDFVGVYQYFKRGDFLYKECDGERHPIPYYDSVLMWNTGSLLYTPSGSYVGKEFLYGFKDFAQMRAWFYKNEWLVKLHEHDMNIVIMEGEVYVGSAQAVINGYTAVRRQFISISDFLADEQKFHTGFIHEPRLFSEIAFIPL